MAGRSTGSWHNALPEGGIVARDVARVWATHGMPQLNGTLFTKNSEQQLSWILPCSGQLLAGRCFDEGACICNCPQASQL
jgi:hypothetical protein